MNIKKKILGVIILIIVLVVGIKEYLYLQNPEENLLNKSAKTNDSQVETIPTASVKPKASQGAESLKQSVLLEVPFVAQAPTGNWDDPRQQDGCEEAAAYMAALWVKGEKPSTDLTVVEKTLTDISDWEEKQYGGYHDTSAEATLNRILKGYFKINTATLQSNIDIEDIKTALSNGDLVLVPADGQALNNPHFTNGGPDRHFLAIIGYDTAKGEFITNDNGTRHGKSYRYKESVLMNAIQDYPTGNHLPIEGNEKVMIVVSKD